jgi:hypothetical protein
MSDSGLKDAAADPPQGSASVATLCVAASDLGASSAAGAPRVAPLSDDLIWEIKGIAEEIGKSERQTFHLVATGAIPAAKIGGRIVASRSRLREHFRALLGADRA